MSAREAPPGAILLDVEGTTTPLGFVKDVLFPAARRRLAGFLGARPPDPDVVADLARLRVERKEDERSRLSPPPGDLEYALWLMDRDRKSPALKSLQGKIWLEGYRKGDLRGEVFEDVPRALERWRHAERGVYVFSSGSVLAQEVLFRHSTAGDIEALLSGHFDTGTGPKTDAGSYRKIADACGCDPAAFLFLSDAGAELDAAARAGMDTRQVLRPGNAEPRSSGHRAIRSFDEVP